MTEVLQKFGSSRFATWFNKVSQVVLHYVQSLCYPAFIGSNVQVGTPKIKKKPSTRKKASQQTKAIFEAFGQPCCLREAIPVFADVLQHSDGCVPSTGMTSSRNGNNNISDLNTICNQLCTDEKVPVAQGGDKAAVRAVPLEAIQAELSDAEKGEEFGLHACYTY